jgi:hypothetical protein
MLEASCVTAVLRESPLLKEHRLHYAVGLLRCGKSFL